MVTRDVEGVIRVAYEGRFTGGNTSLIVNVFHFCKPLPAPVTQADFSLLNTEMVTGGFMSAYLAIMPTAYTLQNIRYSNVYGSELIHWNVPLASAGTRETAGERAPLFVANHINWMVTAPSRRGKGKTYWGGLYEGDINGDQLVGGGSFETAVTAWMAACARWHQGSGLSQWRMGVLSDPDKLLPEQKEATGKRPAQFYEVEGFGSTAYLSTQARRKINRGA